MADTDYKEAARRLWMMLDDIDTLDDACRADDAAFRRHAREVQRKRFAILSGEQMDVLLAPGMTPCGEAPAPDYVAQLERALAECRDAVLIPKPGDAHEVLWGAAIGSPLDVPAYVRAALGVDLPHGAKR